MTIKCEEVDGVVGLVESVTRLDPSAMLGRHLWFRGVPRPSYTLKPKIYRDGKSSAQVYRREARLMTRFRQRSVAYWRDGYRQTPWEHLFAMQHYGVPTRLLDWSENLFVAAYFAALPCRSDRKTDMPVVWAMDPVEWNRATPIGREFQSEIGVLSIVDDHLKPYEPVSSVLIHGKSPLAIYGTHNTDRILAQRGTFVVWGDNDVSQEEIAETDEGPTLYKFSITTKKSEFAKDLRALGFTRTMFFPDLASLADELTTMEGWV